jgi:hypothetical protein
MPRPVQCHKRPLRQLCSPQSPAFHPKQQRFVGIINQRTTSSYLLCLDQLLRIAIIGKLAKSVIDKHRYTAPYHYIMATNFTIICTLATQTCMSQAFRLSPLGQHWRTPRAGFEHFQRTGV